MGDMSKSNNTGMKKIDSATSVEYSHGTNHLGERCLFLDNVDCNESCDGFTVEQIDFLIRMLEKQREVMIDQYNSDGMGELFDNVYELED